MSKYDIEIAELQVPCTYKSHEIPIEPGEVCVAVAESAVKNTAGEYQFRCPDHEGLLAGDMQRKSYSTVRMPVA